MPRGDRGERTPLVEYFFPLVGVLLALGVVWGLGYLNGRASNDTQSERYQSYRYAPGDPQAARATLADKSKPPEYRSPCQKPEGETESDLCAQWKAARAAEVGALWTKVGSVIGIFSALGIVVALVLTIDSNRIARDTAKRQLRPYIGVEPHGINEVEDENCRVPIDITNRGQTPAHNILVFSRFTISSDPRAFDPAEQGGYGVAAERENTTLGPSENRFVYSYFSDAFAAPYWDKIAAREMAIIHYGYISYSDNFGETHETHYAFYHHGQELSDLTSLRCRFGNHST